MISGTNFRRGLKQILSSEIKSLVETIGHQGMQTRSHKSYLPL